MGENGNTCVNSRTFSMLLFDEVCFDVICKGFEKTIANGIDSGPNGCVSDALAKFLQLFRTEFVSPPTVQSAG